MGSECKYLSAIRCNLTYYLFIYRPVLVKKLQIGYDFFKWYNSEILIPFVQGIRSVDSTLLEVPAWYQLDGENEQIKAFQNPQAMADIKAANILIGKPPGSTTSVTQPADVGKCFLGSKSKLAVIEDKHVLKHYLQVTVQKMLTTHINKYKDLIKNKEISAFRKPESDPSDEETSKQPPKKERKVKTNLTPAHQTCIRNGLIRIHLALSSGIKRLTMMDSFAECGIYPFDLSAIMAKHKCLVTQEDRNKLTDNWELLKQAFKDNGEIPESLFDQLGIGFQKQGKTPKDQLSLCRRRSVEITHEATILKEETMREMNSATKRKQSLRHLTTSPTEKGRKKAKIN